jgi:hypothetical protein
MDQHIRQSGERIAQLIEFDEERADHGKHHGLAAP